MKFLILFLAVMLCSSRIQFEERDRVVIWNVGQGLWITFVSHDSCEHFDMGGEKAPWKKIAEICGNKMRNSAYFSHWDLDHISFVAQASTRLRNLCVGQFPAGPTNEKKRAIFEKLKRCNEQSDHPALARVEFVREFEIKFAPFIKKRSVANDYSRIYFRNGFLMPGDSSQLQEKIWMRSLVSGLVKVLVLGHHGSNTSSSSQTLSQLKNLRLAIASARKKRYGHPHRFVLQRLRSRGIATLSTEHWNNIVIEIEADD